MLNFLADENVTVVIPFLVDGEFVSPDTGTVSYSVRDNSGTLIVALTDVAVAASGTEAAITISSSYNSKSKTYEKRSVIVKYEVDGRPYQQTIHYRLHDWVNYTAVPDDVRAYLALSSTELPDNDVDLLLAYMGLQSTAFDSALVAGDLTSQRANRAVVLKAVQDLLPSLRFRVLQVEQSSTTLYKRLTGLNLEGIEDAVASELEACLSEITGISASYPAAAVLGTRTDPITGA